MGCKCLSNVKEPEELETNEKIISKSPQEKDVQHHTQFSSDFNIGDSQVISSITETNMLNTEDNTLPREMPKLRAGRRNKITPEEILEEEPDNLQSPHSKKSKNDVTNNNKADNKNSVPIENKETEIDEYSVYNDLPRDAFSRYIFDHINKIRTDPKYLIPIIKESETKICKEFVNRKGVEEEKNIFKGHVNVALNEGLPAFEKAIEVLENTEPMKMLEFSRKITVDVPRSEEGIRDKEYLKNCVDQLKEEDNLQGVTICSYWRDVVRDPEISFLLMIVDDLEKNPGAKRGDILNREYKYIGINSFIIKKHFACYVTFGK